MTTMKVVIKGIRSTGRCRTGREANGADGIFVSRSLKDSALESGRGTDESLSK